MKLTVLLHEMIVAPAVNNQVYGAIMTSILPPWYTTIRHWLSTQRHIDTRLTEVLSQVCLFLTLTSPP